MPRIDWPLLLRLQTATILLVLGLAWSVGRRCLRRVRVKPAERADALFRFRYLVGQLPLLAVVAPFALWEETRHGRGGSVAAWYFAVGWTGYVVAWFGVTWTVASTWRALRPDSPDFRALVTSGLFAQSWFILAPLVAGWAAVLLTDAAPWSSDAPDFREALCFALGLSVSSAFVARLMRPRAGSTATLAPAAAEAFARAAGEGALPDVVVAPLARAGIPLAYAVRRRRRAMIWIDADVVATYAPDETSAVLLHELGHHRLGHLRRREWTWKAWLIAIVVVPTLLGCGHVVVFLVATCLVRIYVLLPQWRRQETEADAFAADRAGARSIGAALVRLHRFHDTPDDLGGARRDMAHPDLKRRLEALGLTPADVAPAAT